MLQVVREEAKEKFILYRESSDLKTLEICHNIYGFFFFFFSEAHASAPGRERRS